MATGFLPITITHLLIYSFAHLPIYTFTHSFMQNKPNFRKAKMNLNFCSTKDYENKPRLRTPPKQPQSNPTPPPPFLPQKPRLPAQKNIAIFKKL